MLFHNNRAAYLYKFLVFFASRFLFMPHRSKKGGTPETCNSPKGTQGMKFWEPLPYAYFLSVKLYLDTLEMAITSQICTIAGYFTLFHIYQL